MKHVNSCSLKITVSSVFYTTNDEMLDPTLNKSSGPSAPQIVQTKWDIRFSVITFLVSDKTH